MKELDYQYMMLLPFVIVYNLYFFRRTHQSGHHEVLGGAPGVADTLCFRIVVLKLGGSTNRKGRS